MATDDREQQFERALAKHLRDTSDNACPDAEVLSAYHERTLSLEEMAKWKEHIAGCERCQETLALVEQTDSLDVEVWQEQNAVTTVEDQATMSTLMRPAAARMTSMEEPRSLKSVAAVPAVAVAKRLPRAQWKWIVPIGAVAAGIIVWVGVVEIRKQYGQNAPQAVQTAQNQEPATPGTMTDLKAPPSSAVPRPPEELESRDENKQLHAATPAAGVPTASPSPRMVAPNAAKVEELDKKRDATAGTGFGSGNGAGALAPAAPSEASREALERRRNDLSLLTKDGDIAASATANAPVSRVSPAPAPPVEKGRAAIAQKTPAPAAPRPGNVSAITGTVRDPSGAAIGGAIITATDTTNGKSKTAVADASGNFALNDLPADQYRVVVAQSGFAKSEQTLTLAPEQNEQLQVQLKLGATAQTVEVTAGAAAVNTQSADSVTANTVSSAETSELAVNGRNVYQLVQLAAADPRYILSPDRKIAWRAGDGGKIERSTDQGKTWKLQNSGVSTDLRAGSATSDKVCWVIGKAGTILMTANGGKHWKQVTSPITEDVGGIDATDAQHATIWDIPNRKSFQTSDGGVTWTQTTNE